MFSRKKEIEILERHLETINSIRENIGISRDINYVSGQISDAIRHSVEIQADVGDIVHNCFEQILKTQGEIQTQMIRDRKQSQKEREAIIGCLRALEEKIEGLSERQEVSSGQ